MVKVKPVHSSTSRREEHLADVFSALGNSIRLQIILMIGETKRPLHIKAVAENLQMDYAAVYRHIDVLKKAGLVRIFEVGRSRVLSPIHLDTLNQIFALAQQIK
jgi:DNA-binding transcriptional ArsR family regulator